MRMPWLLPEPQTWIIPGTHDEREHHQALDYPPAFHSGDESACGSDESYSAPAGSFVRDCGSGTDSLQKAATHLVEINSECRRRTHWHNRVFVIIWNLGARICYQPRCGCFAYSLHMGICYPPDSGHHSGRGTWTAREDRGSKSDRTKPDYLGRAHRTRTAKSWSY